MKKVIIYTAADKRPDFIPVQQETLKRFVTDEYEYVILNNALGSSKRRALISKICADLGIKCIEVKKDSRFTTIGGQKSFSFFGFYKNANVGTAYPIKWAWENICEENKNNIAVIIDSDMFLCRPTSFNQELGGSDAGIVIQYRGIKSLGHEAAVTYPWNGICIFDVAKIPNLKDLNWDCGILKDHFVNGCSVDVGGYGHFWLEKNKINIKYISEYAVHDFKKVSDKYTWLSGNFCGNFQFSFEYNRETGDVKNFMPLEKWWKPGDRILPHTPDGFEKVLAAKTISYFEKFLLGKANYPTPTFLGFIEFENFQKEINPFIIHNKAGSGYMGFDANYGRSKLEFIRKTLDASARLDEKIFRLQNTLFNRNIKTTIKAGLTKVKKFVGK